MEQEDLDDLMREVKKLRRLEQAVRCIVEDEGPGAGHIAHADDCNSYHAWGADPPCDCYVKDVHQALDALDGTVLDDIVEALEAE